MAVEVDWEAMEAAKAAEAQRNSCTILAKCGKRRLVRWHNGTFQAMQYTNEDVPMEPVSGAFLRPRFSENYNSAVNALTYQNSASKIEWLKAGKETFHIS